MKKQWIVIAALAACGMGAVQAQETPWMVRARAVHLDMSNHDSTGLGLSVNNKTIPEVDVSYFFSPNVAAELILTVPQKQTVSSNGTSIGTFKHLPPTLLMQYHFTGLTGYKPYVGAGINYTDISKVNLLGGAATLDKDSWGGALQAGVDIPLDKNWSLNFDVKKVYIKTRVYAAGVNAGTLKLDPVLVGAGIGYRF
ncbi:OmpW/AlkL family protein [Limnohabitans lacus]|uniref:OmpW family outer membrane protein n=1 Tax=Limnohabitans lacus TaxID=3045173 RepID=A0ABT6X734_9BURK|nr:OmpW family outer membrane protein [Limnohabitans sp. HM2-2]MDI9233936.1 OmpW family outer membrane protein [Limnohabitans sp. HM2-2]